MIEMDVRDEHHVDCVPRRLRNGLGAPQMSDTSREDRVGDETGAVDLDHSGAVTEPRDRAHVGLRAAARLRVMCTAADASGAASTRPNPPKRQPAPIVRMRTTSGLRSRAAPIANGCTRFCSNPFASSTTTSMIKATVVPCAPSARTTANPPAMNAPMYGT